MYRELSSVFHWSDYIDTAYDHLFNVRTGFSCFLQVYAYIYAGVCMYICVYICMCICMYMYIYMYVYVYVYVCVYIQQLSPDMIWLAIFLGIAPLTLGQWYLYDCPRVSDANSEMLIICLSSHNITKRKWAVCAVLKKSMLNGRSI